MKYPIGTNIGDLTITNYTSGKGNYTLTCKCGKSTQGHSAVPDRAIKRLLKYGYVGCQICNFDFLRNKKMTSSDKYSTIYYRYRKSAKKRGLNFDLTIDQASELFAAKCTYCGASPDNTMIRTKLITYNYTGMDRLDPSRGYEVDNVVPCCQCCNVAKYMKTPKEFMQHIEKIYNFNVQRSERKLVDSSESKWEISLAKHLTKENDMI